MPALTNEFWAEAIETVKKSRPDFLFLAEAYWDLEPQLQSLGFDYTYDKRLYDQVMERNPRSVQEHLLNHSPRFCAASAHFLENHDERRVASLLNFDEHRAAALLMLGLPGMRLLHEGQMTGARIRTPVQLRRRPQEPIQSDIAAVYDRLLAVLPTTAVGSGECEILNPRAAWPDPPSAQNFVLVQWHSTTAALDLVAVNLAPHRSQCYAPLKIDGLAEHDWEMKDRLGQERFERRGVDLQREGLYLDLPPHGAQLFHFQPVEGTLGAVGGFSQLSGPGE